MNSSRKQDFIKKKQRPRRSPWYRPLKPHRNSYDDDCGIELKRKIWYSASSCEIARLTLVYFFTLSDNSILLSPKIQKSTSPPFPVPFVLPKNAICSDIKQWHCTSFQRCILTSQYSLQATFVLSFSRPIRFVEIGAPVHSLSRAIHSGFHLF